MTACSLHAPGCCVGQTGGAGVGAGQGWRRLPWAWGEVVLASCAWSSRGESAGVPNSGCRVRSVIFQWFDTGSERRGSRSTLWLLARVMAGSMVVVT